MPIEALFERKQDFILVFGCVLVVVTTIIISADADVAITAAIAGYPVERRASTTDPAATTAITATSSGQFPWLDDGVLPFALPHDP